MYVLERSTLFSPRRTSQALWRLVSIMWSRHPLVALSVLNSQSGHALGLAKGRSRPDTPEISLKPTVFCNGRHEKLLAEL